MTSPASSAGLSGEIEVIVSADEPSPPRRTPIHGPLWLIVVVGATVDDVVVPLALVVDVAPPGTAATEVAVTVVDVATVVVGASVVAVVVGAVTVVVVTAVVDVAAVDSVAGVSSNAS